MSCFGFLSPLLLEPATPWRRVWRILPEKWRFYNGPLPIGEITGNLLQRQVQGWGWKLPCQPAFVWDKERHSNLWRFFFDELEKRDVKVVGLEAGASFQPPLTLISRPTFPGISDGKALELLLFINRFRRLLRNYDISPRRAKALIVWEEGNLGLSCARLIAREVRFLTLVFPDGRFLERAADLIMAETGVVPQIYSELPPDYKGAKVVIKCGRLTKYRLTGDTRKAICCELFTDHPKIFNTNSGLSFTLLSKAGQLPLYPALGEAILRSCFGINTELWYGPKLPLERVFKLAVLFKELGFKVGL